jgi:hypothetical protein
MEEKGGHEPVAQGGFTRRSKAAEHPPRNSGTDACPLGRGYRSARPLHGFPVGATDLGITIARQQVIEKANRKDGTGVLIDVLDWADMGATALDEGKDTH